MSESGDDFGLVLQSALIFLSAIAAIASYIIQSRLKSKEHNGELNRQHNQELRKIRLQRVREKLDTFVGPASQISSAFWYIYFTTLAPKGFYPRKLSIGNEIETKYNQSLDDITDGAVTKYFKSINIDFTNAWVKPNKNITFNQIPSFVSPEMEEQIRKNPEGEIGTLYIMSCRRMILGLGKKLADLILNYGGHLHEWSSREKFKKKYYIAKDSGYLRQLYFVQFIGFIDEFEYIIKHMWDKGNYTLLYPKGAKLPMQLFQNYFPEMVTTLREKESELGIDSHNEMSMEEEWDELLKTHSQVVEEDHHDHHHDPVAPSVAVRKAANQWRGRVTNNKTSNSSSSSRNLQRNDSKYDYNKKNGGM